MKHTHCGIRPDWDEMTAGSDGTRYDWMVRNLGKNFSLNRVPDGLYNDEIMSWYGKKKVTSGPSNQATCGGRPKCLNGNYESGCVDRFGYDNGFTFVGFECHRSSSGD